MCGILHALMSQGSKRGAKETPKKRIDGIIHTNRRGVGYLAWPLEEAAKHKDDIEVSNENLKGALNGDTVEVELTGLFPRPKGKVTKVVERAKEEFVATLETKGGVLVAIPADQRFYRPISLMDASN